MNSLPLLYLDEDLAIINKPSGLLVHRSTIDRNETEFAMQILRDQLGQWVYPVHRLDKATSGVLVFALSSEVARLMMESFVGGGIAKSYLAVVRGFTKEAERIDSPLREETDRMTDQNADKDQPAKEAITEYHRLATAELPYPVGRYATARYSLVHVNPLTGRTHQIRRHMKHIFHPILGDTTHGDGKQNDFLRQHFNCRRLLLHGQEVAFDHPCSGQRVQVRAPLDETFNALLEALQWANVQTTTLRIK